MIEIAEGEGLARLVARRVGCAIAAAVAETGWCNLALGGGSVLKGIYQELGLLQLPWEQVVFYFAEERCVGPRHPASNYALALDRLFDNPRIELHQVQRIEAEQSDHEAVAARYAEQLPREVELESSAVDALASDGPPADVAVAFDVCLLVLEADGAVAGWFPGPGLAALVGEERFVVPVAAPRKPLRRITLTPRALATCHEVFVVAAGEERRRALAAALAAPPASAGSSGGPSSAPPTAWLPAHKVWLADRAAAGGDV